MTLERRLKLRCERRLERRCERRLERRCEQRLERRWERRLERRWEQRLERRFGRTLVDYGVLLKGRAAARMADVGGETTVQRQAEGIVRPGSPIAVRDDKKMRAEQLNIFQMGAATERALGEKIESSLTRQRSFFDNTNSSLQLLASELSSFEDDGANSRSVDDDQRDDTKSKSFHMRSGNTSLRQLAKSGQSLRGPSFSFSSLKLNQGQGFCQAGTSFHKYTKIQGSLHAGDSCPDRTSVKFMDTIDGDEDSDDDGSLKSSVSDGEDDDDDDGSVSSGSEAGEFIPHTNTPGR